MAYKDTIKIIPLTSIAATTFDGSYKPINPLGLPNACSIVVISNLTDQLVTISDNGSTDKAIMATNTVKTLQLQANALGNTGLFAKGTVFYAKASAGMAGSIYVEGYYQPTI